MSEKKTTAPAKKTVRNSSIDAIQKNMEICEQFFEEFTLTEEQRKALDFVLDSVEKVANEKPKVTRKKRIK